jgi:hypothetical protein
MTVSLNYMLAGKAESSSRRRKPTPARNGWKGWAIVEGQVQEPSRSITRVDIMTSRTRSGAV